MSTFQDDEIIRFLLQLRRPTFFTRDEDFFDRRFCHAKYGLDDKFYVIGGQQYARIRYGEESEDWGADTRPCHDCAVIKGQYHVRGCDAEECPVCHGQAISCQCEYDRSQGWGEDPFV